MKSRISQETFDEAVKENVEEFGMTIEEAVADVIGQFIAQGVDLSNIDTSCGQGGVRSFLSQHLNELKKSTQEEMFPFESTHSTIKVLITSIEDCANSEQIQELDEAKGFLGTNGAINTLCFLVDKFAEETSCQVEAIIDCLKLLKLICLNHVENKDSFVEECTHKIIKVITTHDEVEVQRNAIGLIKITCIKVEVNKANFMRLGGANIIARTLSNYQTNDDIMMETFGLIKAICHNDDFRKDFSCTYDNTRIFLDMGLFPQIMSIAIQAEGKPRVLSSIFIAIKQLATNNDSVKALASNGCIELLERTLQFTIQQSSLTDSPIVAHNHENDHEEKNSNKDLIILGRNLVGVLRNISANEDYKNLLCNSGSLDLMLSIMDLQKNDSSTQEHCLATISAMALRSPDNSKRIVSAGAIPYIIQAMKTHGNIPYIQKYGCLAIRNLAARSPELHSQLLDGGVEILLKLAGRFQQCVDEAYAALRELKIEAQITRVDEFGNTLERNWFGDHKPNFNPTLQKSEGIQESIENNSKTPKELLNF